MKFARGAKAFGFCDRCGLRSDLRDLKYQTIATKRTKLRVCPVCLDKDHPQYLVGRVKVNDPQALRDPRQEGSLEASRALFGWSPVGSPLMEISASVGSVSVSVAGPDAIDVLTGLSASFSVGTTSVRIH